MNAVGGVGQRPNLLVELFLGETRNSADMRRTPGKGLPALHPHGVPMFAQRIYVGRDPGKNAMVNLSDKN